MKKHLYSIILVIFGIFTYPGISWAHNHLSLDTRFEDLDIRWREHFPGLLPDLHLRQVHIYKDGPRKGEGFLWVTGNRFPAEPGGFDFDYEIFMRPGFDANAGPRSERIHHGSSTLNSGEGLYIEIPRGVVPEDGKDYTLYVEINRNNGIAESTHNNNSKRINQRFDRPAVITIDNLFVRENCDRRSPGEWRMMYEIQSNRRHDPWRIDSPFFDTEDYTNYPIDPAKKGFATLLIANLPIDTTLRNRLSFADCNKFYCERDGAPPGGAEEGREHWFGGADDSFTGWATAYISPEKRLSGEPVEATTNRDDCGFTATFKLMEPEQAREQGYEYEEVLLPRWRYYL